MKCIRKGQAAQSGRTKRILSDLDSFNYLDYLRTVTGKIQIDRPILNIGTGPDCGIQDAPLYWLGYA